MASNLWTIRKDHDVSKQSFEQKIIDDCNYYHCKSHNTLPWCKLLSILILFYHNLSSSLTSATSLNLATTCHHNTSFGWHSSTESRNRDRGVTIYFRNEKIKMISSMELLVVWAVTTIGKTLTRYLLDDGFLVITSYLIQPNQWLFVCLIQIHMITNILCPSVTW